MDQLEKMHIETNGLHRRKGCEAFVFGVCRDAGGTTTSGMQKKYDKLSMKKNRCNKKEVGENQGWLSHF